MNLQTTLIAIGILTVFPMAANAQGFGNNININLNDVMVGQRMQDMQQRLNNANTDAMFVSKKHQKQDKKNKHRMALLQNNDDSANSNNNVGTVSAVNHMTDGAAESPSAVNIQQ